MSETEKSRRRERTAIVAAFVLLALALAASEAARFFSDKSSARLAAELAETKADAAAALQAVIPPALLEETDASVYMVTTKDGYVGTAFVIDRERGLLATAAHVAEDLVPEDAEQKVEVLNRASGKPLAVRAMRQHAGYGAFRRLAERHQPIDPDSEIGDPYPVPLIDFVGDAAILVVDPLDPENGENRLGPSLPIAARDTLLALKPGDPIAIVSFPSDSMTLHLAEKSASSRVERGVIAAMLSPIDLVDRSGDRKANTLIAHRMATAGGSSGAPILNRAGEVIGINSHGFDSPQSNGDSLAQRADLLHDLLSPLAEEEMVARVYRPDWEKRLARWPKAEDVLPYSLYVQHKENSRQKERETPVKDVVIPEAPPYDVTLIEGAFLRARRPLTLDASDAAPKARDAAAGKIESTATPVFRLAAGNEYAVYELPLDSDLNHVVYGYDYAVTYSLSGYCPVGVYHRKLKEKALTSKRPAVTADVFIPATKGAKTTNAYQFIFSRSRCRDAGPGFTVGLVSWKPEGAPATTTIAAAPKVDAGPAALREAGRMLAEIGLGVGSAAANVRNFADCEIPMLGDEARCVETIEATFE